MYLLIEVFSNTLGNINVPIMEKLLEDAIENVFLNYRNVWGTH